jgi:hypothetical protein
MPDKKLNWWDYVQFVTPIIMALVAFIVGDLRNQIQDLRVTTKDMSTQIVTHLCNSEIHIPRATVVSRDEFYIYQSMRDKQMAGIQISLDRLIELHNNEKIGK